MGNINYVKIEIKNVFAIFPLGSMYAYSSTRNLRENCDGIFYLHQLHVKELVSQVVMSTCGQVSLFQWHLILQVKLYNII